MRVSHIGVPHLEQTGRTAVVIGLSAKWAIGASAAPGHFDRETSLIAVRLRLDWSHLNYVFRTITKFDQKA
jgi:hypothetical protein